VPASARTRRQLLRAAGAATVAGIAGCLGGDGSRGGAATTAGRDVLRFESLSVAGSPGGQVPLRPPDRPALLDFFATWCGPCEPQMETLGRVREQFAESDLWMVSITPESDQEAVAGFWRRLDGAWPVVMDAESEAAREYGVSGLPTLVLVAPDGTEHWRHRGLAGHDRLVAEVEAALGR
jgi:thiol-disulfide isomerase/thioredoxin